jgi:putative ABC transport system permease protein
VGAAAARRLGLAPGATLLTDPAQPFDLTRAAALRMRVVGVLAPTGGPEDEAVLTDLRTVWAATGLIHGHRAVAGEASADDPTFAEVTEGNLATFHAHGEPGDFPVSAVLVIPNDARALTLLRARLDARPEAQAVAPAEVVDELLGLVLQVRTLLAGQQIVVGVTTLALVALVGWLAGRLRAPERVTLRALGAGRWWLRAWLAAEWVVLLAAAAALAGGLVALTAALAPALWRWGGP